MCVHNQHALKSLMVCKESLEEKEFLFENCNNATNTYKKNIERERGREGKHEIEKARRTEKGGKPNTKYAQIPLNYDFLFASVKTTTTTTTNIRT